MATSADSLRPATTTASLRGAALRKAARTTAEPIVRPSRVRAAVDSAVKLRSEAVANLHDRRRRRRAAVAPMYSSVILRVLSRKGAPLEGHVVNLSENGMSVEIDSKIPIGQPVTLEFRIAGLGRVVGDQWSEFAAAGEVVRFEDVQDFPGGPYRVVLRFVRIATMAQAQIARYVATHAG